MTQKYFEQNSYHINAEKGLKIILENNVVIHCHHYNARLQRTIESNPHVDGKSIFKSSVVRSFYGMLMVAKKQFADPPIQELASQLYSHLGFGNLDVSAFSKNIVKSTSSHFVEGWRCGTLKRKGSVCTFVEGFLEAVCRVIYNKDYDVIEKQCMNDGHDCCLFEIKKSNRKRNLEIKKDSSVELKNLKATCDSSNVDSETIIKAVINMPILGNNEGLIPAFNVYLGHMPQNVYNLMTIGFVEAMEKKGLADIARQLLIEDAEHCALNTFSGILNSDEWAALIAPMIEDERDKIFALASALGWGRINVVSHADRKLLVLSSMNGYEAHGYLKMIGKAASPQCYMLTGIEAGLMELIYEKGEFEDRVGVYSSQEETCLCRGQEMCKFTASRDY